MRLALEGQSDSLETGRDQPDQHPDLFVDCNQPNCSSIPGIWTPGTQTATLPWGDRSPSVPISRIRGHWPKGGRDQGVAGEDEISATARPSLREMNSSGSSETRETNEDAREEG